MTTLVEAEELARELQMERPPVVADVRWNLVGPPGLPEFEGKHIPGAQWVDLEHELAGAAGGPGGRHPLPPVSVFQSAMRRIGINRDSAVVVSDAANALPASRLWWLLTDAGLKNVRVLNGGLAAWRAVGLPVETGPARSVMAGDFVAKPGQRRVVSAAEVTDALAGPDPAVLVDVRARERYTGETEPMDPVAGHIPGAINLPSMANVTGDGRFVDPATLAARYADAGLDESSIVYCGSGITAAHTLLALQHAGLADARLYAGSWSDWVSDPERPVATGDQPGGELAD